MKKIIILLTLLLLTIGIVSAVNIDDFAVPSGYGDLKDGTSYLNDGHTTLYIGKLSDNENAFESDIKTGYIVSDIGDNISSCIDEGESMYGIQEKVVIDGVEYLVCIYKDSELSTADKTLLSDDLKSFNEKNGLEPIAV